MMPKDPCKLLIVLNPIAGGVEKADIIATIEQECQSQGFNYKVMTTTGRNDEALVLREINRWDPEVVVAMGGDGTCNLVARLLAHTPRPMGIIPVGSANGLGAELNIPDDFVEALNVILRGQTKTIDLIEVNGKLCIHLSDLGFNANLVKRFHVDKVRGMMNYSKQFFLELVKLRHHRHTFVLDGHTFSKKACMVVFANASKYGTGAIINPDGDMSDGKFEVCIVRPFPWYALVRLTVHFFNGRLKRSPYVKIISCHHAVVLTVHNLNLQVDGEVIGKTRQVEARVLPGALRVIVPQ